MIYKIIRIILSITAMILLGAAAVYELCFAETTDIATLVKVCTLFVIIFFAFFNIRHKQSVFDPQIYTIQYKSIIGSAFQNDRKSMNMLINAIKDLNCNKPDRAIETLDRLYHTTCIEPDDYSAVLTFKALCQQEHGFSNEVVNTYKLLLKHDETCAHAWNALGMTYYVRNEYVNAETALINAVKYAPDNADYCSSLANFYLTTGNLTFALSYALNALDSDRTLTDAMAIVAVCFKYSGNYEKAEEYTEMYQKHGGDIEKLDSLMKKFIKFQKNH